MICVKNLKTNHYYDVSHMYRCLTASKFKPHVHVNWCILNHIMQANIILMWF